MHIHGRGRDCKMWMSCESEISFEGARDLLSCIAS